MSGSFAIGPAIGGAMLSLSPDAVWWGGALVCAVVGAGCRIAGDRIPDQPRVADEPRAELGDALPEPA